MSKVKSHCKQGHERSPENLYPNKTCKKCAIERSLKWQKDNPELANQRSRQWQLADPDRWRQVTLKTKYKFSDTRYDDLLEIQHGVCAVCKKPPLPNKPLVVDHNHACCRGEITCGKCVRGLIHKGCNAALGAFADDPAVCRNAAEYLEHPPAQEK